MRLYLATAGDIELLRVIRNSCREFMNDTTHVTQEVQQKWWDQVVGRYDFLVYVAYTGSPCNVVCGYGIIRRDESDTSRWWLTGGLLPNHRDAGLGGLLFTELMTKVRELGGTPWLQVRVDNMRARKLYERLGFQYTILGGEKKGIWTMRLTPTIEDVKHAEGLVLHRDDTRPQRLADLPDAFRDDTMYYRLFWELGRLWHPLKVLEIGTDKGVSAAHWAAASPDNLVVTIDHNAACGARVEALGYPNIHAVTSDSTLAVDLPEVTRYAPYDVLFIDGNHTYNQAKGEFTLYQPLLVPGALVFFDDIDLPMKTFEMQQMWREIVLPKASMPKMHHTGFGVVQMPRES